ncbi:uncharacterized protein LOC119675234 [Teleopsis dalmanni]|uniref:uncharacterized protein LOC119675234 n=1 Tax=Teleopsis dalmanni TaxID=139649 RepID=UPI0018CE00D8|nr:uncharacterized protein LOC119675234 [Teleopsis dalmanni]
MSRVLFEYNRQAFDLNEYPGKIHGSGRESILPIFELLPTMSSEKLLKKKQVVWPLEAENILCELWEEDIENLRGNRRNSHIYKEFQQKLSLRGMEVSVKGISNKINNLTSKYRKEKAAMGMSGGSPSTWPLYHKVHAILGSFKIHNVETLMDETGHEDNVSNITSLAEPAALESNEDTSFCPLFESVDFLYDADAASPLQQLNSSTDTNSTAAVETTSFGASAKRRKTDSILQELQLMREEDKRNESNWQRIEERRNDLLERLVNNCENYQQSLLEVLNKK